MHENRQDSQRIDGKLARYEEKKGCQQEFELFDDAVFELELRTSLINWKARGTHSTDHELVFLRAPLPRNGVATELTEIAIDDLHCDITLASYKVSLHELQMPCSPSVHSHCPVHTSSLNAKRITR